MYLSTRGSKDASKVYVMLTCSVSLSLTYVLLMDQILDEVERRRGISAALVYPFMRSLMESPFPAPGKTIKVKTFLPGAGNEVKSNCKHYKSKPYPLPLQYQNSKRGEETDPAGMWGGKPSKSAEHELHHCGHANASFP